MDLVLFLLILCIYLFTLSPSVFWWDSGEVISGCYLLDILHSPGYALYSVFGKLFTFIPVGDISFRINLLSSFFGAISVFAFYFLCLATYKNKFTSFFSALVFAFSYTLWLYSVIAETFTTYYFLGVLLIYLLIITDKTKDKRFFYFYFFVFCLSVFLHPYFCIFLPIVLYTFAKNKILDFKNIILLFAIFFISSCTVMYLPIRSAKPIFLDFGDPENFLNFLKMISFREGVSSPNFILNFSKFLLQVRIIVYFFSRQIPIVYFIFSAVGLFVLLKYEKKLFFMFSILLLLPSIPLVLFDIEEPDLWNIDYILIISYIVFFLLFFHGITYIFKKFTNIAIVLIFVTVAYQFYCGILINDRSKNKDAYVSGKRILDAVEKNSILLTDNISLYNLLKYFQSVEQKRKDVSLLCTTYLSQCWYLEKIKKTLNVDKKFFALCRSNIKYNDRLDAEIAKDIFLKNKNFPFYILFSKNREQEIFWMVFSKYNPLYLTEIVEFRDEKIISPFTSVLMRIR